MDRHKISEMAFLVILGFVVLEMLVTFTFGLFMTSISMYGRAAEHYHTVKKSISDVKAGLDPRITDYPVETPKPVSEQLAEIKEQS